MPSKIIAVLAICWLALLSHDATADSRKPVRIAVTEDLGQQLTAHLAAAALKRAGYKVDLVAVAPEKLVAAIVAGEVHVQPEWPVSDAMLVDALASDALLDMGRRNSEDDRPEIRKIVWRGMKKPWPGAVKLFGNMTYPTAEQDEMVAAIQGGATLESVVEQWMGENRDRWQKWKSVTGNWMKP